MKAFSRLPKYELTLTGILPAFNRTGDRFVTTGRPAPGTVLGTSLQVAASGSNQTTVLYRDKSRNVMAPSWSPTGDRILFGIGVYNLTSTASTAPSSRAPIASKAAPRSRWSTPMAPAFGD